MNSGLVAVWEDVLTGEEVEGLVVNTSWCPVTSRWNILVAGFDGVFKNVTSDTLGLQVFPGYAMEGNDGQ